MEQSPRNKWIQFEEVEWNDDKYNRFHVDTRDFYVSCVNSDKKIPGIHKINKQPKYFHTEEEIKELVLRLYTESGGKGEWRMLDLEHDNHAVRGWDLKYLRICKTEKGFIVFNSYWVVISKHVLKAKVNQEYLCHH